MRNTSIIKSWPSLLKITKAIGGLHYNGREAEGDRETQKVSFAEATELQSKLLVMSDMKVRVILMRHSEAYSDSKNGVPGTKDELLTPK